MRAFHRIRTCHSAVLLLAAALLMTSARQAAAEGNPMTVVGEQHNRYLVCLLAQKDRIEPLRALVERCGLEPGEPLEDFVKRYSGVLPPNVLDPLDKLMEPYREHFDDDQYAYLSSMERILIEQDPVRAKASLEELEKNAVSKLGREASDLAVLSGLSTARFSLDLWTSKNDGEKAQFDTGSVVRADATGAAVGWLRYKTFLGTVVTAAYYSYEAAQRSR